MHHDDVTKNEMPSDMIQFKTYKTLDNIHVSYMVIETKVNMEVLNDYMQTNEGYNKEKVEGYIVKTFREYLQNEKY